MAKELFKATSSDFGKITYYPLLAWAKLCIDDYVDKLTVKKMVDGFPHEEGMGNRTRIEMGLKKAVTSVFDHLDKDDNFYDLKAHKEGVDALLKNYIQADGFKLKKNVIDLPSDSVKGISLKSFCCANSDSMASANKHMINDQVIDNLLSCPRMVSINYVAGVENGKSLGAWTAGHEKFYKLYGYVSNGENEPKYVYYPETKTCKEYTSKDKQELAKDYLGGVDIDNGQMRCVYSSMIIVKLY
jgi:hypothetical protein